MLQLAPCLGARTEGCEQARKDSSGIFMWKLESQSIPHMVAVELFPWDCLFIENKQKPGMMPQCDLNAKGGRVLVLIFILVVIRAGGRAGLYFKAILMWVSLVFKEFLTTTHLLKPWPYSSKKHIWVSPWSGCLQTDGLQTYFKPQVYKLAHNAPDLSCIS